MGDFAPSVEAAQKALGTAVPIEQKVHPPGAAGVRMSLDDVALRIRKGRNDPRVRAWAIRAIHAAGSPQKMVDQARAILAALKQATVYVQDPLNTEFIQAAHETLCLDDKGLCFRGGDCDDLSVAYGSAALSVGIPTKVVGQSFNSSGIPQHVLVAIQDPSSLEWLRVDPSTDKPLGEYVAALQEWWIDPLDVNDKTSSTIAGAGDYVGVGNIGLGDFTTDAVVQQVQTALFSLQSSSNDLAAALQQVDNIKSIMGYDPEPTTPINGLSDFPSGGVWTQSMSNVCHDLLSQADFLASTGTDALKGVRTIFVDPTTNEIGIGSLVNDPYKWNIALQTATDAIIGIYSPTGALIAGITQVLGAYLSSSQVQAEVQTPPSGTIQGVPRGVGTPAVVPIAIAAAAIVATVAIYLAYQKYCATALSSAQEATMQSMVAFTDKMVSSGKMTPAQAADFLSQQRQLTNQAQAQNNNDNPFANTLASLGTVLKWGVVIGGVVLIWPILREASEAGAMALKAKRVHT